MLNCLFLYVQHAKRRSADLKKNLKTDQKWNSINEPRHEKTTMSPSVTRGLRSNQPSLRMKKCWDLSYSLSAQQRLWSDWVDTQADQSLRWAHTHFVGSSCHG